MAQVVKRAGISLADGRETTLGFWPDELDQRHPEGTWVARIKQERTQLLRIAKRHHEQNQAVAMAKASGQKPVLAEPEFRVRTARVEQKMLADIEKRVALIGGEAFVERHKLKPFKHSPAGAALRAEMRALLRTMDPAARAKALAKPIYREAALEGPAELSALDESVAEAMREQELREKFPTEMQAHDDVSLAEEATLQALKACKRAVESELIAVGEPVTERSASKPEQTEWA